MTIDFEEQQLNSWIEEKLVCLGPTVGVPNQELCAKFREFFIIARGPRPGQSGYSEFEERIMWATHKLGRWLSNEKKVAGGEEVLLRNVYLPYLRALEKRENRAEEGGADIISLVERKRKL